MHFDGIRLSERCQYLDEKLQKRYDIWKTEKLTLGLKNDMRNLRNFNVSSGKFGILHFDVLLFPIAYKV